MNIMEIPIEMRRAIIQWLPILDQLAAAEASEGFAEATELQIEHTTLFVIKPKKVWKKEEAMLLDDLSLNMVNNDSNMQLIPYKRSWYWRSMTLDQLERCHWH
jgi:hypothetical protein